MTLRIVDLEHALRFVCWPPPGDFWHNRGILPVEPLNAVLAELESWNAPTIMMPGNHDQVYLFAFAYLLEHHFVG